MKKAEKAVIAVERLEKRYPKAVCSLIASKPHELLIATRLSAQCTDARVNIVTKPLFEKYKSVDDFANAKIEDVEEIIRSCGLYKTKARDVVKMCVQLRDNFNGEVPDSIEKLTSLSGIGRKTANLIMGDIYKKPAVVTDTHLIRISNRLGLVDTKDPYKVEIALKKILPPEKSSDFCHRIVHFGREVCKAPTPKCENCEFTDICKEYKTKHKKSKS